MIALLIVIMLVIIVVITLNHFLLVMHILLLDFRNSFKVIAMSCLIMVVYIVKLLFVRGIRYRKYITIMNKIKVIVVDRIIVYTIVAIRDICVEVNSIMVLVYKDNTLKIIFKIYIFFYLINNHNRLYSK